MTGAFVLPTVYFLFPETSGQSLEEISWIFERPRHWWLVPRAARQQVAPLREAEDDDLKAEAIHVP